MIETKYKGFYITNEGDIIGKSRRKMKGHIDKCGYIEVCLYMGNYESKMVLAHRLILETLNPIENMEEYDVNHKDGNKTNNHISNLEWNTRSENILHSFKNKLQDNINGNPIISNEDILYIKENLWRLEITQISIVKKFKISRSKVQNIIYKCYTYENGIHIKVLEMWNSKATYNILGKEINKCDKSIQKIVKIIKGGE